MFSLDRQKKKVRGLVKGSLVLENETGFFGYLFYFFFLFFFNQTGQTKTLRFFFFPRYCFFLDIFRYQLCLSWLGQIKDCDWLLGVMHLHNASPTSTATALTMWGVVKSVIKGPYRNMV